jgi:hypothetical protein
MKARGALLGFGQGFAQEIADGGIIWVCLEVAGESVIDHVAGGVRVDALALVAAVSRGRDSGRAALDARGTDPTAERLAGLDESGGHGLVLIS